MCANGIYIDFGECRRDIRFCALANSCKINPHWELRGRGFFLQDYNGREQYCRIQYELLYLFSDSTGKPTLHAGSAHLNHIIELWMHSVGIRRIDAQYHCTRGGAEGWGWEDAHNGRKSH